MTVAKYKKEPRPQNPYARLNRVIARMNNEELQLLLKKAHVYTGGEVSELIRRAILAYKGGK